MYAWCIDGPFAGKQLWLDDHRSGTLSFRVRGWTYGRYLPRAGSRDLYWRSEKDLQSPDASL